MILPLKQQLDDEKKTTYYDFKKWEKNNNNATTHITYTHAYTYTTIWWIYTIVTVKKWSIIKNNAKKNLDFSF